MQWYNQPNPTRPTNSLKRHGKTRQQDTLRKDKDTAKKGREGNARQGRGRAGKGQGRYRTDTQGRRRADTQGRGCTEEAQHRAALSREGMFSERAVV